MSGRLIFMYESYGDRGADNMSKFWSGEGRIEDHWAKENILAGRWALNFSDLKLRVEMKKGDEGEQEISCDYEFSLIKLVSYLNCGSVQSLKGLPILNNYNNFISTIGN